MVAYSEAHVAAISGLLFRLIPALSGTGHPEAPLVIQYILSMKDILSMEDIQYILSMVYTIHG